MNNFDINAATSLTNRLLSASAPKESGEAMNDLLSEFHRGYPIENLKPFLQSNNVSHVKIGAWIASELGGKGAVLLDDVSPLLQFPDAGVRISAVDCVLVWAGPSHGREIASVIDLLGDPDRRVRWKVMDFLSRATSAQLSAAECFIDKNEVEPRFGAGLRLLLRSKDGAVATAALEDKDVTMQKFGVVLARRI